MPSAIPEVHVPMPIPDELTDEERAVFSAEVRKHVTQHLVAVRMSLREAGVTINDTELTRFGAQLYIDGFRAAIFKKAVTSEVLAQLHLPFRSSGQSH